MKTKTITYYSDFQSYDELINFLDNADFIYKPTFEEFYKYSNQEWLSNNQTYFEDYPELKRDLDREVAAKLYQEGKVYLYGKYKFIARFMKDGKLDCYYLIHHSSCYNTANKNHWCRRVVVDSDGNITLPIRMGI